MFKGGYMASLQEELVRRRLISRQKLNTHKRQKYLKQKRKKVWRKRIRLFKEWFNNLLSEI